MHTPTNSPQRVITKTIWMLSLVSLFTDMASEMLYPVMPVFLKHIGFSVLLIGTLEGLAEAVAGLSKSYFGKMSDSLGKRLPFVQLGYALSAISKPMMALFIYPAWIFLSRTMDRIGKGVRTGARDAMLSDEATPQTKGRVFGFHRSMDTMGAVFGPAIALAYLYYNPESYTTLFLIAFAPGLLAIIATLLIKEKKYNAPAETFSIKEKVTKVSFFAFASYWKNSPADYKRLVAGLLVFALFNSSDVFLLLKMKESGLNDTSVIGIYIFYNLVYAMIAYPIGIIADKIGLKKIFITGIVIFCIVYSGFAFNQTMVIYGVLFTLYAMYAAATEGISKAWISNMVNKKDTATAIGTFSGFQSIAALVASTLTGFLWLKLGPQLTFLITSVTSLLVAAYLVTLKYRKPHQLN